MTKHGYKEIDADNLFQPDPAMALFGMISPETGHPVPMTAPDWLRFIQEPQLSERVPEDIQRLYEVARGAIAYGYLFYPLFTLGEEQLYRVLEAAARGKCQSLSAPPGALRTLKGMIDWLVSERQLSQAEGDAWDALRELRNHITHMSDQRISLPGASVASLGRIADLINRLYA